MKKCPECGNPSYDGAPVCGNCGYVFPKQKNISSKNESIFQDETKKKKDSDEPSTIDVIKEKRLIIGTILIITIIVICGIFLMGGSNNNSSPISSTSDLIKFSEGDFSFNYPGSWEEVNETDAEHEDAIFFKNKNNAIIEYYNISTSSDSLKEITQQRISYAQENGAYVELVETITLDGRNASNIVLENADGDYTRFVSMFSDGKLYVFKITGDSINSITSDDINSTINSADIA